MKKMIRIIIMVIIYVALYAWMSAYKLKSHNIVDEGATSYSVTLPNALKYVYTGCFLFGVLLAAFFAFLYIKNKAGATIGHITFAFVFATIGLIVMLICVKWRIDVDGNEFTIYYILKPAKTYTFQEVDRVEIGTKGELVIYIGDKKVRTIDALATNREMIERKFESESKITI